MSFVLQRCLAESRGTQYIDIDACAPVVSQNSRISQHNTFNDLGEIIAFIITPGKVSDVNHELGKKLSRNIWGQLLVDTGYISKKLKKRGIELITKLKKNIKK